jgi:hypothetical protein
LQNVIDFKANDLYFNHVKRVDLKKRKRKLTFIIQNVEPTKEKMPYKVAEFWIPQLLG